MVLKRLKWLSETTYYAAKWYSNMTLLNPSKWNDWGEVIRCFFEKRKPSTNNNLQYICNINIVPRPSTICIFANNSSFYIVLPFQMLGIYCLLCVVCPNHLLETPAVSETTRTDLRDSTRSAVKPRRCLMTGWIIVISRRGGWMRSCGSFFLNMFVGCCLCLFELVFCCGGFRDVYI